MLRKFKSLGYKENLSGNMAVFLALSLPVIVVAIGAAVDIADTTSRKTKLQSATDISVLAAARSGETKRNQLEKAAKDAFNLNFDFNEGETLREFDVKLLGTGELSLITQITKPTSIMSLFGRPTVNISTEAATFLPADTPLDIALVLDRTGSMAGANITGLISASDDFIAQLEREGRDIRISVVPFADYVNVGTDKASAPWLDMPSASGTGSDVTCSMESASSSSCLSSSSPTGTSGTAGTSGTSGTSGTTGTTSTSTSSTSTSSSGSGSGTTSTTTTSSSSSSGCTTTSTTTSSGGTSSTTTTSSCTPTGGWSDVSRTTTGGYCTLSATPQENSGGLVEECTPAIMTENWFGCVGSRPAPNNAVAEYDGEKIPPIFDRTCGQPIMELTDKYDDVRTHIATLTASGGTYIPSGLQWGWRTLMANSPLEPKKTRKREKLLILMTDGQNTRSQQGATHTGNDYAGADKFTLELCDAIKGSEIELATVAYSNGGGNSADTDLLSACASKSELHFSANDSKALLDAFSAAADQTGEMRLVR